MNYHSVSSWWLKMKEDEILLQAKFKEDRQKVIVWKDSQIKSLETAQGRKLKRAKVLVKIKTHQSTNEFLCQKFHQTQENQVEKGENRLY